MSETPPTFENPINEREEFVELPTWTPVANYAALPEQGAIGVLYILQDNGSIYQWNGTAYEKRGGDAPMFPAGSCSYPNTWPYPTQYTIKDQSGTIIGYVNMTYDESNNVTSIVSTDADANPLPHGSWTMTYDSGNLISTVCTN